MGSRDRKETSRLIYNYCRIGNSIPHASMLTRLCVAEFLCNTENSSFFTHFKPHWLVSQNIKAKLELLQSEGLIIEMKDVFPCIEQTSALSNKELFVISHWTQPHIFIRLSQRAQKTKLLNLLNTQQIAYQDLDTCLKFAPNIKLDEILGEEIHYELQDWASQQTGQFFLPKNGDIWWDCCAASGGKSLLLHSLNPNIKLYVSDIRESSLFNLKTRFQKNKIQTYTSKVIDTSLPLPNELPMFDGIILDAPCSGSGTWGRAPENLLRFDASKIVYFQTLQRNILRQISSKLKKGKPLIYITCSVFEAENEAQLDFAKELGLTLERYELIEGYSQHADTMFVARFIKN